METYNHLLVRLTPSEDAHAIQSFLNALPGHDLEWELDETLDSVAAFQAMGGSSGWEDTETAARALIERGNGDVWTYCTHDEDSEALFSRITPPDIDSHFIASSAYADWSDDEDEGDAQMPIDASTQDMLDDTALSDDTIRAAIGEHAYCWGRYDRWKFGLPNLSCLAIYQELIEDIVGPRR